MPVARGDLGEWLNGECAIEACLLGLDAVTLIFLRAPFDSFEELELESFGICSSASESWRCSGWWECMAVILYKEDEGEAMTSSQRFGKVKMVKLRGFQAELETVRCNVHALLSLCNAHICDDI